MKKLKPSLLKIRIAKENDAFAIKQCVQASYQHYVKRMGQFPQPMTEDYSRVILAQQVFVVEENSELVGLLVLQPNSSSMLLNNIAVHPNQQGKGLGRRLLELAESEARQKSFDTIELYTNQSMVENINLYKHFGYVETERQTVQNYQRVFMMKNLS